MNFLFSTDNRVQLFRSCGYGQVHAQLVQSWGPSSAAGAGCAATARVAQNSVGFGSNFVQSYAQTLQHSGCDAFTFPHQANEQVLRADIGVVHAPGFVYSEFNYFLGAGGESDLALGWLFSSTDDELYRRTHLAQVNCQAGEHPGRHAFGFAHKSQEDVLGPNIVVVKPLGLFLS